MAAPNSSDVGPITALLSAIDSTFIAILMGIAALLGAIGTAWKILLRLHRVEEAIAQQRVDHEKLAKIIEPLAGIDKRLNDIQALLVKLVDNRG